MGFAQKTRKHCHHQEQEQPGTINEQGETSPKEISVSASCPIVSNCASRPIRPGGLPAGSFKLIVEGRVLKMIEIKRCGVFHQADARMVGKQITQ